MMGAVLWGIVALSSRVLPMVTLAGAYGSGADALVLAAWLAIIGWAGYSGLSRRGAGASRTRGARADRVRAPTVGERPTTDQRPDDVMSDDCIGCLWQMITTGQFSRHHTSCVVIDRAFRQAI